MMWLLPASCFGAMMRRIVLACRGCGCGRTALILHDLEELDCAQTAQVMGVSVGAAKVRIHRARARLKAALEQGCGFYHDADSVLRCEPRR
jgi:RNA polymerase sigma-70 factor (ECF subfamily)